MKTSIGVSILFIFLIISCNKFNDVYYNLDHSVWYKYNLNDTLIYKSFNKTDSFTVYKITNGTRVSNKTYHYEFLDIVCRKINSSCNNCEEIGIGRENKDVTLNLRNFYKLINYSNNDTINYIINNYTIYNVYTAKDTSLANNENDIICAYYNDIYGVIRYEQKNGEIFELQLK